MDKIKVVLYTFDQNLFHIIFSRLVFLGFEPCNIFWSLLPWSTFIQEKPSLIILDEKFLLKKSAEFLAFVNGNFNTPILLISENECLKANILNEYISASLTKPFLLKYFDCKVLSILGFLQRKPKARFAMCRTLELHVEKSFIKIDSNLIPLTKTELDILSLLLKLPYLNSTKASVLKEVWDYSDVWSLKSNILEMHISKLKLKLSPFFNDFSVLSKKETIIRLFS